MQIIIDLSELYTDTETAKIAKLAEYTEKVLKLAGSGNEVILKGQAPIWLYLKIAHALHGKASKLIYNSPVTGDLTIFDHTPF